MSCCMDKDKLRRTKTGGDDVLDRLFWAELRYNGIDGWQSHRIDQIERRRAGQETSRVLLCRLKPKDRTFASENAQRGQRSLIEWVGAERFVPSYPDRPPKMKFITPIWHPNGEAERKACSISPHCQLVYPNGDVCISILHEPGEDATNPQESASMRWNPIHTVETIVISVISMLSDPTDESPANLDAAVREW
eukprot:747591-Hanusia_phi.AAC.7